MFELGNFPVKEVVFGSQTRWHNGSLEINRDELLSPVLEDQHIAWADLVVVNPGDKTRIINKFEAFEPRVKVKGPGVTYPAVYGRPTDTVGKGRTHRLSGIVVVGCVDWSKSSADEKSVWGRRGADGRIAPYEFLDMSGPGAVANNTAHLINICLTMEPTLGTPNSYWHESVESATWRLSDRLAQTMVGLEPPEVETFNNTPRTGLPGVVFVLHLAAEGFRKAQPTVYGMTGITAPWLLSPTELMDGAIFQGNSWRYTNNSVVSELFRRHGQDWNFLACIVDRTGEGWYKEKEVRSNRVAEMAKMIGAQGAIVASDARGYRHEDVMLTIKACEKAGIKTVFLTMEEDSEEGLARPLIVTTPELVAVVSTGRGDCPGPCPEVKQVVGARDPEEAWFHEQPPVHGRYAIRNSQDSYGYGRQSYTDDF